MGKFSWFLSSITLLFIGYGIGNSFGLTGLALLISGIFIFNGFLEFMHYYEISPISLLLSMWFMIGGIFGWVMLFL